MLRVTTERGGDVEQLRLARLRRGWSQAALAEAAGVQPSTVLRLEHGTPPRPATLAKLCRALGCALDELLTAAELAVVGTRPRAANPPAVQAIGEGAAAPGTQDRGPIETATPPLICWYDSQPLDVDGDCWHIILADAAAEALPVVAHLACWQGAQPRPTVAPCCRRDGACEQRWA
jgi:transcriptional regulator with XRE-family HTH domain